MDRVKIQQNLEEIIKKDPIYVILRNYAGAELAIETAYKINFHQELYIDISFDIRFTIEENSETYSYIVCRRRVIFSDSDPIATINDIKEEVFSMIYDMQKVRKYIHLHGEIQECMHSLMNRLTNKAF